MPASRLLAATATAGLAFGLMTVPAVAQDHHDRYQDQGRYDDRDDYDAPPPPAGVDIAHDYLRHEYYDYEGLPPRDPRAGEQEGWRDGQLHTPPRDYWRRCGCSRLYYGNHWYNRPALYDYDANTFDSRAHYDQRGAYEYRWPRRPW